MDHTLAEPDLDAWDESIYRLRLLGWSDEMIGDRLDVSEATIRRRRMVAGIDDLVRAKAAERGEELRLAFSAAHTGAWARLAHIVHDKDTDPKLALAAINVVIGSGQDGVELVESLRKANDRRLPAAGRAGPGVVDIAEERRAILSKAAAAKRALEAPAPGMQQGNPAPPPRLSRQEERRSPYAPGTAPGRPGPRRP